MSAAAETDDSNAPSIATRDCVCYESSGSASGEPELIVKMVTTEPTDPFLQQTWDAP